MGAPLDQGSEAAVGKAAVSGSGPLEGLNPSEPSPSASPALRDANLRGLLQRAADALHDAGWIMEGAETEPPLPPPITLVLPQTKRVEAEIRQVLDAT